MSNLQQKFVRGPNDYLYNPKYIKSLNCDENKCSLTIANTEVTSGPYGPKDDKSVHCWKQTDLECYNRLKSMVDKL